jgi:rhodanese-related sulfurtransferase
MVPFQWIEIGLIAFVLFFAGRGMFRRMTVPRVRQEELNNNAGAELPVIYLDVRTDAERRARHIDGSLHIPLHELRAKVGELSRYRGSRIVCYCQSGSRSLVAASILKQNGYTALSLERGMAGWLDQDSR